MGKLGYVILKNNTRIRSNFEISLLIGNLRGSMNENLKASKKIFTIIPRRNYIGGDYALLRDVISSDTTLIRKVNGDIHKTALKVAQQEAEKKRYGLVDYSSV